MLSFETFEKLNKKESYSIYTDLYQQKNEHDSLKMLLTQLLARMDDTNKLLVKNFNFSTENKEPNEDKRPDRKEQSAKQLVKPMNSLPVNSSTENLIIGSSIIKRIPNKSLPEDVEIHAYSGSTSSQKLELLRHYSVKRPLQSLTIQDGTNTILKNREKNVSELFENFQALVSEAIRKFEPKKLFLCETPPLRIYERNKIANCRIEEWNNLLHEHYGDGENIQIIDLNKQVKSFKNPETLYFDDIHFNFQLGLPLIRNSLMKYITWYSNNLPRINTTYYRPNSSYWRQNTKYPKYTHRNQYQYYHHQPLTTFHYMGDA